MVDGWVDPWSPERAQPGRAWASWIHPRAVGAGVVGALWASRAVHGQGGVLEPWSVALVAVGVLWAVALSALPRRWGSALGAASAAAALGALAVAPVTGGVAVTVAVLGVTSHHGALVRPLAHADPELRVSPLALAAALAGGAAWVAGAPLASTVALHLLAVAATLVAARRAPAARGEAALAAVERAVRAVVVAVVSSLVLAVAVPLVYAPGAVARAASAVAGTRRRDRSTWTAAPPAERGRRDARYPFAAPRAAVSRRRHLTGGVVVVVLVGALLADRWTAAGTRLREVVPVALPELGVTTTSVPERSLADRLDDVPYRDRLAMAGLPYADALQEQTLRVQLVGAEDPELGYRLEDSASDLVNVRDGVRATAASGCRGCPAVDLWLVGGSLVFGIGQRDEGTIASHLVRAAAADGIDLRVTNLGVPGYTLVQETAAVRARLAAGARPDLVVFLDGYNDTLATLMDALLTGAVPPEPARLRPELADRLLAGSGELPEFSAATVGTSAARRYRATAEPHDRALVAEGIEVAHAFQPDASSSPVQRRGVEALEVLPAGFYEDAKLEPLFEAAAGRWVPGALDLRHVLDDLRRPVYIDTSHVNEEGAEVIARALHRRLADRIGAAAG